MTPNPKTIRAEALAAKAARILDETLCNQLLVIDENKHLIGALHVHDLMTAKVI
jgi:arabinose-5-phosphate isomerase